MTKPGAGPTGPGRTRNGLELTSERELDAATVENLYPAYVAAWGPLRTEAAARHVLTREEFVVEMTDSRIDKLVVWDGQRPAGLATMTNDLSAVPWISAEYYSARYPDAAARGALYYLGYIFVGQAYRRSCAFLLMTDQVNRRLHELRGVLAFDFCAFNDARGIGRHAHRLLSASRQIDALDVQAYYAADYRETTAPSS